MKAGGELKRDQLVAWTATTTVIVAAMLNAFDNPYQKYLFFLGCLVWAWAGYLWRQPSLIVLNVLVAAIYIVGWIV